MKAHLKCISLLFGNMYSLVSIWAEMKSVNEFGFESKIQLTVCMRL